MSTTASEDLFNRVRDHLQREEERKNPNQWIPSMEARLKLEGCYMSDNAFDGKLSVYHNGSVIGTGPSNSYQAFYDALQFIVARERLKGKHVQH